VYAHVKGIQIDPVTHGMLDAAFPGWMGMREVGKHRDAKEETRRQEVRALARVDEPFDYG
jgi:hypothetical protein